MIIIKHKSALIEYYQGKGAGTGVRLTAAFALSGQNTQCSAVSLVSAELSGMPA